MAEIAKAMIDEKKRATSIEAARFFLYFNSSDSGEALHGAQLLAQTPLSFFLLALFLNARLLIKLTLLHFTEETFLLQLTLEDFNRFFDVAVNHSDFHEQSPRFLYQFCSAWPQEFEFIAA